MDDYLLLNLEVLIVRVTLNIYFVEKFMKNFFKKPNLKELHLCGYNCSRSYPQEVLEMLDSYRKQGDRRVEMIVYGFPYENYKSLSEKHKVRTWLEKNTAFLLQNLSLVSETVYSDFKVDYDTLDTAGDEQLKQFVGKFKSVRQVTVSKSVNEQRLLHFLIQTKPTHLVLNHFNYSIPFLKQLRSSGSFLQVLVVDAIDLGRSRKDLKNFFWFLLRLENLTSLKIVNGLSYSFAMCLLKVTQSLKDIRFHLGCYELKNFNDWRMIGICFTVTKPSYKASKGKYFSTKNDLIRFLSDLYLKQGKPDSIKLFDLLPNELGSNSFYGFKTNFSFDHYNKIL